MEQNVNFCEECGTLLVETLTDNVCPSCGLVQSQKFVEGTYKSIDSATSFGNQYVDAVNKPSLANGGSGSFIDFYGNWNLTDYSGQVINQGRFYRYARLKRMNDYYSQSNGQLRLYRALQLINRLHGVLDLPEVLKDEISKLYRKCYLKLPSNYRIPLIVAACFYLSTRLLNYNLLLKEIVDACERLELKVKGKTLINTASEIKKTLKLQIRATRPEEYLEKAILSLSSNKQLLLKLKTLHIGLHEYIVQIRTESLSLIKLLDNQKRGGRNPYILASAIVAGSDSIVSSKIGKKRGIATQKIVAESCNIPEYTLREHYIKIIKPIIKNFI
jgi:transcription initiation factor TFIIIB Brf1 subunit/transcription initiation factor TFIIB